MIARELFIFVAALAVFASGVSAYLFAFHGEAGLKDVASTTAAALIGMYAARYVQRGLGRG